MDKSILDHLPRDEWERLIQQHVFDEQSRYMLRRCMLDGLSYQAVAEESDVSYGTVFKKVNDAFLKVKRHAIKIV